MSVATITPAKVSSQVTFLGGLEKEMELEDAKKEAEKELNSSALGHCHIAPGLLVCRWQPPSDVFGRWFIVPPTA